jgi:carboxyl-terminal processing protease
VFDAAVEIADDLLEQGVIVSARGRSEDAQFVEQAQPGDISGGADLIVLVNGASASAAEILAAALRENQRALLYGRRTYGKGSVQTIMPLSGGQALKLTTSIYYTPQGNSLNHHGLAPDVEIGGVEPPPAELDPPGRTPTLASRDAAVGIALQALRSHARVAAAPARQSPRS